MIILAHVIKYIMQSLQEEKWGNLQLFFQKFVFLKVYSLFLSLTDYSWL